MDKLYKKKNYDNDDDNDGVLPVISSAPVIDESEVWVLGEGNSSDEAYVTLMIGTETSYSAFSCSDREDGVYKDPVSCSLHYRCSYGRREIYKCLDGYLFNPKTLRCEEERNTSCTTTLNPCQMRGNGLYANHSTNCQDYYRCENLSLIGSYSCGPKYAFSIVTQGCVPVSDVMCIESQCSASGNGYYILPGTNCQAYYHCHQGIRTDYVCPQDTTYDRQKKACVHLGGPCFEPLCTGRINGRYADTSHGCERSFACSGGVLQAVFGCPQGQLYNGQLCISSKTVMCQPPESTAVVVKVAIHNPCASLPDGSHPIKEMDDDCRTYVICKRGQNLTTQRCPIGQRFDGRHCADAKRTPCISECVNRPDGCYPDLTTTCRDYFYCSGGILTAHKTCAPGTVFNGYMCVPSQLFMCPLLSPPTNFNTINKCNSRTDGFHTDYSTSCRDYFFCSEGKIVLEGSCTQGQIWNGHTCVEEEKFLCRGPEPWPGCVGLEEGLYQDFSSHCQHYHYCENGNRTVLACPEGKVFDGKMCVPASNYKCPTSEPDICNERKDGYYSDPDSNCRSYYYCSKGHKITYICPGSSVFNGKECVDPLSYTCLTSSKDCTSQSNGYHYDIDSGCHKYFYCLDSNKITTLTCAGNKIFNGRKCVELAEYKCPASNNPCDFQPDGLRPHVGSQCRQYVHCRQQKQISIFTCSGDKIFDGSSCIEANGKDICVSSKAQFSPRPSPECSDMPNGFYQNFTSNCRSYYFCIDGMKTILTCPANEIFNGQVCVDSNSYTCPSTAIAPANPCLSNSSHDVIQKEKDAISQTYSPT